MDLKNSQGFYEEEARSYDNRRWNTSAGRLIDFVQKGILDDFTRDVKCLDVLEIGAGTGRFTSMLLDKGNTVTALDISSAMLEQLNDRLKDHPKKDNLKVLIGDARDMNIIRTSSLDGVISFNALSHIPEHKRVFAEVSRVLKPGGFFIFNIPNYLSLYLPFGLYVNLRKKSVTRDVYTRWYSLSDISRTLSSLNMDIQDIRGQLHVPTLTPDFIIPLIKVIDNQLRSGIRARFAPILFIKARKLV